MLLISRLYFLTGQNALHFLKEINSLRSNSISFYENITAFDTRLKNNVGFWIAV